MPRVVAQVLEIGPFFAGDTGPEINWILLWDTGGYVDLTGSSINCSVKRWDFRRKIPFTVEITGGVGTLGNPLRGECTFSWLAAGPLSSVPVDPGWYTAQLSVQFPDGQAQQSQRVIFEVMSGA